MSQVCSKFGMNSCRMKIDVSLHIIKYRRGTCPFSVYRLLFLSHQRSAQRSGKRQGDPFNFDILFYELGEN